MKYIITESKLDKIVFGYLDSKDFNQLEEDDHIFFENSNEYSFSQIVYKLSDRSCFISHSLYNEISSLFSLSSYATNDIIGRWVENTIQMKVSYTEVLPNRLMR